MDAGHTDKSSEDPKLLKQLILILFATFMVAMLLMSINQKPKPVMKLTPQLANDTEGVTDIIVFSDFQCSFCHMGAKNLDTVKREYGDKVKITIIHYPLASHPKAFVAAQASECARDQEMFWQYHDILYESANRGDNIGELTYLLRYAQELGLDMKAFTDCMDSSKKKNLVIDQMELGVASGVRGTPTYFIEGKPFVGVQSEEKLRQEIDLTLKN